MIIKKKNNTKKKRQSCSGLILHTCGLKEEMFESTDNKPVYKHKFIVWSHVI